MRFVAEHLRGTYLEGRGGGVSGWVFGGWGKGDLQVDELAFFVLHDGLCVGGGGGLGW